MEEWRDIINYEGLYQVSNLGRVRSLDHSNSGVHRGTPFVRYVKGRILTPANCKGYKWVHLSKDGIIKNMKVHRLVAIAFLPNPNCYDIVNHKDRNPSNNEASNLEWCTQNYNVNYGGAKPHWGHNRKQVEQLTKEGEHVACFSSTLQAARALNIKAEGIRKVCQGRKPSAYGFKWRYTNG